MNNRIDELAWQAGCHKTMRHDPVRPEGNGWIINQETLDKFAELILEDFRDILGEVYRETPLEFSGYLLALDEKVCQHFYGVKE